MAVLIHGRWVRSSYVVTRQYFSLANHQVVEWLSMNIGGSLARIKLSIATVTPSFLSSSKTFFTVFVFHRFVASRIRSRGCHFRVPELPVLDSIPTLQHLYATSQFPITINVSGLWEEVEELPAVIDVFGDGSRYVVDAPGHLPGHINILARTLKDDGSAAWVYLAGDTCHDRRILRGEKAISEWLDVHGKVCCIHADRAKADETIERVRDLKEKGVELIIAHDVEWEEDAGNARRFFGA
ncbi:hypothetical protein F4801DRAFT_605093 [Xylaria longipes]|nr:hypothetical protein F4801DRAFT_605093 [Xylaria longipes]